MAKTSLIATVAIFGSIGPAMSFPCDDFNTMQFSPSRLEQCIHDMKFIHDVQINTLETENRTLQSQICILALELRDIKPSAYEAIKEMCALPKSAKKRPAAAAPAVPKIP